MRRRSALRWRHGFLGIQRRQVCLEGMFPGYYRPTADDFDEIWRNGLFVLDANVLLNLYRYSDDTRQELLRILRALQERLWLPHRAASEYLSSRVEEVHQQRKKYEKFREELDAIKEKVANSTKELHRDSVVEAEELLAEVRSGLSKLADYLREKEERFAKESNSPEEDAVWREVSKLFADKIGDPYEPDREKEITKLGYARYESQVPPGYKDQNKGEERQFGDLILWFQIIEKAKEAARPVVFVTDDRKEDWWWKSHGKTVGPRPELVEEIRSEAGVGFYMYQPPRFMEEAGKRLNLDVSNEAISEAQALDSIDEEEMKRTFAGYLMENPELAESMLAAAAEVAEERPLTIQRPPNDQQQVGGRMTEMPAESVLNSPGVREAQRFLDSSAAREARYLINSPAAQDAQRRMNSPEVQAAMERLNSPEAQAAFKRLNSPEVRNALKWLRGS